MKMIVRCAPVLLLFGVLGLVFGRDLSVEFQWMLYDSLRNTSSVILGVAGIWIGLIYPDVMKRLLEGTAVSSDGEVRNLKRLLGLVAVSTLIICAVLSYGFLWGILKSAGIDEAWMPHLHRMSFGVLGVLTALEILASIASLAPQDVLKGNLEVLSKRNEKLERLRKAQGIDEE